MPFGIAAILVTSVALSGLTGAVATPQTSVEMAYSGPPVSAESSNFLVPTNGDEFTQVLRPAVDAASVGGASALRGGDRPARAVDSTLLPQLGGHALLDQLALLPARDVEAFVGGNQKVITKLLLSPPSARSVAGWWRLVPDDARATLIGSAPELVGNLDGLPVELRDTANREFLGESIAEAEREIPHLGRAEKADAERRLHMLKEIEESLVTTEGQSERHLLSVDTAWPGRAAVVIGDLQTADYVSYLVPGMFFTVDGQIVDWTVIAQDLHNEQLDWVDRLGRTDPTMADAKIATVSWIGYQTPGIMDIVSLDLAKEGAKFISSSVNGLRAIREGNEAHVTLLTHSYGSTATLMALAAGTMSVDSLVIIGSPGSAAQSVDDLGMPRDQVFVGEAAWDPVVNTAFFGSDPGSDSFGASPMSVAGGEDPITGISLAGASGHLGYFDAGSEAMRNMALVGLDEGELVTDGKDRQGGSILALW